MFVLPDRILMPTIPVAISRRFIACLIVLLLTAPSIAQDASDSAKRDFDAPACKVHSVDFHVGHDSVGVRSTLCVTNNEYAG
jgi:hypothetical protein